MLKSADLHETILTPVICHKHADNAEPLALRGSLKSLAAHVEPFLARLALYHVVPTLGH